MRRFSGMTLFFALAVSLPALAAPPVQDAAFSIDNAHTRAEFRVRHLGVSTVTGRFGEVAGEIWFDPEQPEASRVEVTIQAATITTGNDARDNHLRSADFFDVENHPELTFRSTTVRSLGDGMYEVDGDLTMRGVTQPVTLEAELGGMIERSGRSGPIQTVGFSAETRIDREQWGLTWNRALEAGGWLVGQEVRINLEVEANRPLGES